MIHRTLAIVAALLFVSPTNEVKPEVKQAAPVRALSAVAYTQDLPAGAALSIQGDKEYPPYTLVRLELENMEGGTAVWDAMGVQGQGEGDGEEIDNGKSFVFTGRPGKYRVTAVTLIDGRLAKYRFETTITGRADPIPDPDDNDPIPDPDDDPKPPGPAPKPPTDPIARVIFDAAMKVESNNRRAEASQIADIFSAVAGEAAGVSSTTVRDMLAKLKEQMTAMPTDVKEKWLGWQADYIKAIEAADLSSKDDHIDYFNKVAEGLNAVR
jgi:hypothetical protein